MELYEILQAQQGYHPEFVFTFVARRSKTDRRTGKVYKSGKRYPITYWGLGSWFSRFMKKIGIKNLTIHDLRRSFGSTMLLANDMALASKALGHSSIKVTEAHYAFIPDNATRLAAERAAVLRAARRELPLP